ncbi:MAG: 6-phosphogluconolactonase [Merismopedia sp. SIO2A8]|nr:6-phosphogluconolactonase [Merismopedia sp. SIO2A8]
MGSRTVEVLSDKAAIVTRALELVLERIQLAIATQGQCTLALAGGSTPKPLYTALAQQEVDWSKLHIFWGDERYVPPSHPDSNEGMARAAWLDHVNIPASNIHPMPTTFDDPVIAAQSHDQELRDFFQVEAGTMPALDIILLGMGDDGHTASLFPHTPALQVCDRLVTVGNKNGDPRLTFTIPLINQSNCVIFLVAGANKQSALQQVLAPDSEGNSIDANTVPARYIRPQGNFWWLLDQSANGGKNYE